MSRESVRNKIGIRDIYTLIVSTQPDLSTFRRFVEEREAYMMERVNYWTKEPVYGANYKMGPDLVFVAYQILDKRRQVNAVVSVSAESQSVVESEVEELIKKMGETEDPLAVQSLAKHLEHL